MKDLTPFPGVLHRGKRGSVLLNHEQLQWFTAAIQEYPVKYIAKKMGVSHMTVERLIARAGLQKKHFNIFKTYYMRHPEKLKARNEKIRQKRIKLVRREKFNLRMGLHQESNVYVTNFCLTNNDCFRRYKLCNDGYTVPRTGRFATDDPKTFYYDEHTKRHKIMEKHMMAEGYIFKPLPGKTDDRSTGSQTDYSLREWML